MLKSILSKKTKHNKISKTSEIISPDQPFAYREAYKAMRTNFNFASLDGKLKTILITSSISGEGKSTYSINLAISLVESGKKVLLIDADLRNPSVHRYLRIRQQQLQGLSNLLSTGKLSQDAIGHLEKYNIDILLSGSIPPNPVELLSKSNFSDIIKSVEKDYDYIIIDSAPVGVVTDAAVISQYVDGVVMVVGQGLANQQQINKAKINLQNVNANVIGAILNNYDVSIDNKNADIQTYYYYGKE